MAKIFAGIFGLILLGAVVGLDFWKFQTAQADLRAQGEVAEGSYLDSIPARILPMFESTPDFKLADMLPPAPEGWERRPYEIADGNAITGAAYEKYGEPTDTTTSLLQRLSLGRRDATRIAETYVQGTTLIAVRLDHTVPGKTMSPASKLALRAFKVQREADMEASSPYVEAGGVVLHMAPQRSVDLASGAATEVPHLRLLADLQGQVQIDILTNATPEGLNAFLGLVDWARIAGLVQPEDAPVAADAAADPAATALNETAEAAPKGPCVRKAGVLACE